METPPRTWGRPHQAEQDTPRAGNTPTDVGKTTAASRPSGRAWKHPHGRGEDRPYHCTPSCTWETPPRTWGRHDELQSPSLDGGNTPTDVGKTILHFLYDLAD